MRILAIGDPHCKVSSINEIRLLQAEIRRVVAEYQVDRCIILGDLHDTFEKAHVLAYNAIVDLLWSVSTQVETDYVLGNHDMVNNSGFLHDDHFFKAMKYWGSNLRIVDRPVWVGTMLLCPYVPPGRFVEALNAAEAPDWKTAEVIFCHQEFMGASMGAIESKHGDVWDPSYPQVISGHIHPYQKLGPNIVYVGTPYTTGYGETDKKTVSLFAWDEAGIRTETRIELNIPRKETVQIDASGFAGLAQVPMGSLVRIVISGTSSELTALKKTKLFKELDGKFKLVCKPTDAENIVATVKRQSYVELLIEACSKESEAVRKVLDEVTQS